MSTSEIIMILTLIVHIGNLTVNIINVVNNICNNKKKQPPYFLRIDDY